MFQRKPLSPEARDAAQRLIAILLALLNALVAPADPNVAGLRVKRPFLTRLALRLAAAHIRHLSDRLAEMAEAPKPAGPAPAIAPIIAPFAPICLALPRPALVPPRPRRQPSQSIPARPSCKTPARLPRKIGRRSLAPARA